MRISKEWIKSEDTSDWCYSYEHYVWFIDFMVDKMINRNTCIASHVPYT
jgi:hypothetical protein